VTALIIGVGAAALLDLIFLAVSRAVALPVRSAISLVIRLGALLLLQGSGHSQGLLWAYSLGSWSSVLVGLGWLSRVWGRGLGRPDVEPLRGLFTYCRDTYLVSVCGTAASAVLPVIALDVAGPVPAARFYVATLLATLVFAVPTAVGAALFAVSDLDRTHLRTQTRHALILSSAGCVAAGVAVVLIAPLVFKTFGGGYGSATIWVLLGLVFSSLPMAVYVVAQSVLRATGQMWLVALTSAAVLLVTVGAAAVMGSALGIPGVAMGWLLGQAVGAALWRAAGKSLAAGAPSGPNVSAASAGIVT